MTSRLARHTRIARLRSQRALVPDPEAAEIRDEVVGSGLVEEIEPLVVRRTGCPCKLPVEALLVGMSLASARNGGVVTFTAVTDLLFFSLSEPMREQLGVRRYPDHDRGFEAAYATVRRRLHSILEAIDPSPLPKNHRLARRHAEKLLANADPDELARKRTLMIKLANLILAMSLREAMPLLEDRWNGSVCVDATVIGTYAKGLAPNSPVTATDPDAAWYVRTAKHKDPLALDDLAPTRQDKKGARLQKKTERIKKSLFGYDASLVIARDPSRNGVPLPDGSADPDVVPALVIAFSVDKPSHRPGHVAVEALQQIDDSLPRGYLAGDRAYNDQKPENFQLPIRAMGYEPVYDYAKDQLGVQAGFAGAELVEGNWYCPSMPQELKEATKDLINEKIDKQTWINRIRARAAYLFMAKQRPDAEGHRRVMCPAEASRTQCPLKAYTLGRGIHLPLVDPDPSPAGSPLCCSQKTVTVPPEAAANLWQPLQYGSEAWQRVYFRLRNSIEGINGYAKDPLYERLEDAGTRRIRGIAAQTLLLAFQLAHANRRKLRAWADSIALHDDRPRRRPTRRRKTKPLGTWTPKGYVNEP
ncbi:hypothetical protein [Streptomyces sp. 11x1]|uniref:hypothetical protein n=1 Tax=Streptomyces sp. 11x1 TaxID=3038642 RepID=UPI00292FDC09|nr:hypothetical protein [Streptomyces sp. 11x1]WNZ10177.1 hypothetical protein P8T65_23035 [Streptomyces sp. 11x1]